MVIVVLTPDFVKIAGARPLTRKVTV